jgi:hypothetical protein
LSVETEVVEVSITQDTVALPRAGFGVALVLSHAWGFSDDIRFYGGLDEVAEDWPTTSPEYRSALALFGQAEKPEQIAIGRGNELTLQYTISAQASRNNDSRSYKISAVGQGFPDTTISYPSDASVTPAKIHDGLANALNGVVGRNYVATLAPLTFASHAFTVDNATEILTVAGHGLLTGDGPLHLTNTGGALPTGLLPVTDYYAIVLDPSTFRVALSRANALVGTFVAFSNDGTGSHAIAGTTSTVRPAAPFTVTSAAPGAWFSLELADVTALSLRMTHAGDPTPYLDALELANPNWYCLLTHANSPSSVQATASWIEAHPKIYLFDLPETEAIQTPVTIGTDTLAACKAAGYTRSAGSYHHRPATFMSACWAGRVLPIEPGGDTWALKELVGVGIASKLTTTHRNNLKARSANFVTVGFGRNITLGGTTCNGNFIDVARGLDWLSDDVTKGLGGLVLGANKIPYTNPGVTSIVNQVEASLARAVQRGILRDHPKPVVTAPDVEAVDPSIRGVRLFPDVLFTGQLAGAIHRIDVRGRVSL